MNKIMKTSVLILLLSVAFSACEDKDLPFGAVLETSLETINFGTEAESKYIMVNSNRTFTVTASATWCKAEIVSDKLDNLKISVEKNENVGKQRTADIIVSSEGMDDQKVTVVQEGVAAVIHVAEKAINKETGDEFSLTIEANLLFKYELPEWIHAADGNVPTVGTATYRFVLDPLPENETFRSENIVVRAADSEINTAVTIPVSQGKKAVLNEGVNKENPYIVEAESCLEGLESKYQPWWAQIGEVLGDNYYVNAYSRSVSYLVKVKDAGVYDFSFVQVSWSGGSLKLYIDDVETGNASIPNYSGTTGRGADIIVIGGVALTEGEHIVKAEFVGNSDFDKIIIAYNPNTLIQKSGQSVIEAESSIEGLESVYQSWWAQSGEVLGDNYYVNAYSRSVSYPIKVIDAGVYDFSFVQVSWSGGSLKLYIDDVETGNASIPNYSGTTGRGADIIVISGIALTEGEHILKAEFVGNSDFDKITVVYSGN
jgi:hypothetical protein